MPDSFVALPEEAGNGLTGKKFRSTLRTLDTVGSVHEQGVRPTGLATYYLWAPAQACAANKYFLAYLNGAASGKVRKVEKVFITNAQLAAIASGVAPATVGAIQIDVKRITAVTGGTALTANPVDTVDGAMSSYSAYATATGVTDSTSIFSWYSTNDEIGLTNGFMQAMIQACISQMFEDDWADFRPFTLQPGEGFAVKMITNYTLGAFGVLAVISEEP